MCRKKVASLLRNNQITATTIEVPVDGSLSVPVSLKFFNDHYDREVMLFYYLSDCQNKLASFYKASQDTIRDLNSNGLEFIITHTNSDESHLSSEQSELLEILFLVILIKFGMVSFLLKKYKESSKKHYQQDYCLKLLLIS